VRLISDDTDFSKYLEKDRDEAHVIPASAWADSVVERIHDPEFKSGLRMPWSKTHDHLRFRPGEVTIWSGVTGHGKSMFTSQVLAWALFTERVCIASMEMKPDATMERMTRQVAGGGNPSERFIREFHRWTDDRLWLFDQQGSLTPERVLGVIWYCVDELRINHFMIDSLMKCGIGVDDYNKQKRFVNDLCSVAQDSNIHIHLIAHGRKGDSDSKIMGLFDVAGASELVNQVDNLVVVWRNKLKEERLRSMNPPADIENQPDAKIVCRKQRHGEWEGMFYFWFHASSFQFVPADDGRVVPFRFGEFQNQ
jgi:twinkle protein